MPVFAYQALQPGGGKSSGEIEALSRQDAFNRLRQQNLQAKRVESLVKPLLNI